MAEVPLLTAPVDCHHPSNKESSPPARHPSPVYFPLFPLHPTSRFQNCDRSAELLALRLSPPFPQFYIFQYFWSIYDQNRLLLYLLPVPGLWHKDHSKYQVDVLHRAEYPIRSPRPHPALASLRHNLVFPQFLYVSTWQKWPESFPPLLPASPTLRKKESLPPPTEPYHFHLPPHRWQIPSTSLPGESYHPAVVLLLRTDASLSTKPDQLPVSSLRV